jgi:hypothetical protein
MRGNDWKGLAFLGCLLFLVVGCGDGKGPQRVSGSVFFKGQPLDDGEIQFRPVDPTTPSLSGGSIVDGTYEVPSVSGLMPGKYRVMINSPDRKQKIYVARADPEMGGGYVFKERIPARFNSKSNEMIEVKQGGGNVFDFQID